MDTIWKYWLIGGTLINPVKTWKSFAGSGLEKLQQVINDFKMKHIVTFSGGKDSLATIIWAKNNLPGVGWA